MTVIYSAVLSSNIKVLDGLPISLRYPAPIETGMRLRSVDSLCKNATDDEKKWYELQVLPCLIK